MNTFFRSTLLAAVFVLPTVAFAQPIAHVDENQTEMIAYEAVGGDSAQKPLHIDSIGDHADAHPGTVSDSAFNPAADVGLKSIYVRH
ncbi:hypothetical protein [Paraburkholderia sp.]|jgi:hypothetical protein|uniref:hypothetical protein n=1 Tax=Paraburkholderia sp. TaxID=1926495 RepID=UPI002F3F0B47